MGLAGSHFVCAAALALIACGPNMDEVLAQHRAPVEAQLALVGAVGRAAPNAPLVERDEVGGAGAGLVLTLNASNREGANAALVYLEDFRDLDELGLVYARVDNGLVNHCAALVHTERNPWDPKEPEAAPGSGFGFSAAPDFGACERLKALFVVRTVAFAKPSEPRYWAAVSAPAGDGGLPRSGDGGVPASGGFVFDGGYSKSEVLVYELAGARLLGGFRLEAESSRRIAGNSAKDVEQDFADNTREALSAALRVRLPGLRVIK